MEIQTGPFGSSLHKSDYQLGGTPVINPASLKEGKIVPIDDMAIGHATLQRLEVFKLNAGDIVMARRGEMGRCAIVTKNEAGWLCGTGSLVLRMPRSLFAPYLAMLIGAPMARMYLGGASVGTTMQNLNQSILAKMPVGLPPLAEQKRIMAKVDELMTLCDRLEAQQKERETRHAALASASLARFAEAPTPANLQFLFHQSYAIPPADLRKSILTLTVQGKLVPQDPNDEPAEEIVGRSEAERARSGPHEVDAPVDEAEQPWSLPLSWKWARLGAIANIKHGYAFSSESFTSEPTPFVLTTPGNFYESGGFRDRGANSKYFKGEVPPSFVFDAGDLIIPMTEQAAGLLGSPAFIPDDGKTYLHNQRLGKLEFYSDEVAPDYVFWFFNSEFFRSELARTCTGMKVRHTSPKRILKVPFALPPLSEQRRIVAKVEQLMALVDELESQLAASRSAASNLLSAMVTELSAAPAPSKPAVAKSNMIQLSTRPEFIRSLLAAEIIDRSRDKETFGQTKLQKIIVLAEYLLELREIDSRPRRFPRGPHDPELIAQVERKMEEQKWFQRKVRKDGEGGWKYVPLAKAGGHRTLFEQQWPDKAEQIRRLIDSMKSWLTERCERFATVYAAWNDLIHEKKDPTDEAILGEVLEHWHSDKKKIPLSKWQETLNWMRAQGHVPTGFGRATREPESGELFPL